MIVKAWVTGLAVLVLAASGALAQARGPIPRGPVVSGKLSFDGHASVGDFAGSTTSLSGEMTGGAELGAVRGWVQAPVKTLKTGNGRRDRDLNKSMQSDKYPDIRFELSRITARGGTADSLAATLSGRLLIHGVAREVVLPATLLFRSGEARVRSDFPLNLKDYRIGGLSKMLGILKMYDNIEVHVDVVFGRGQHPASGAASSHQPSQLQAGR